MSFGRGSPSSNVFGAWIASAGRVTTVFSSENEAADVRCLRVMAMIAAMTAKTTIKERRKRALGVVVKVLQVLTIYERVCFV